MIPAAIYAALLIQSAELKADYDVVVSGRPSGKATLSHRVTEEKGLITRLRIELIGSDGKSSVVNQESEYAPDGKPVRKVLTQSGRTINVVFTGTIARVKVEDASGSRESLVHASIEANLRALSELWFRTIAPKPGDICEYHRFDMNELKWVRTKSRYSGEETLKTPLGEFVCHLIETDGQKAWIAADGLPYRMQSGSVVMQRLSP